MSVKTAHSLDPQIFAKTDQSKMGYKQAGLRWCQTPCLVGASYGFVRYNQIWLVA